MANSYILSLFQHTLEIPQTGSRNLQISYRSPKTFPSLVSGVRLLVGKNPDARTLRKTLRNGWSVRQLDRQIATNLRTNATVPRQPPCCSSLHPLIKTFCRAPYATRSFWNFLTEGRIFRIRSRRRAAQPPDGLMLELGDDLLCWPPTPTTHRR